MEKGVITVGMFPSGDIKTCLFLLVSKGNRRLFFKIDADEPCLSNFGDLSQLIGRKAQGSVLVSDPGADTLSYLMEGMGHVESDSLKIS
jgi:hypothetical protein